jgi:hypothetical protein
MIRSMLGFGLILCLTACSNDKSPSKNGQNGKDAGPDGSGTRSTGFKLTWGISDMAVKLPEGGLPDGGTARPPGLPGVKVCVYQNASIPCATTGADGTFTLEGLPPLTNLVLTFEKDGYLKESKTIQTASTDMQVTNPMFMFPTGVQGPSGVTQDPSKGAVSFFAIGPVPGNPDQNAFQTEPGVSVTITPAVTKEQGPYFGDGRGKFDPTATTTLNGLGFFYNLAPGDYQLNFEHPSLDCAPISLGVSGWGIPKPPNGTAFTALAGYMTEEIGVFCTPKSVLVDAGK